MSTVVQFPGKPDAAAAACGGLADAIKLKRVKAVAIVSIETDDNGAQIARVRHGWDENALTVFELLAFSAALDHSKLAIQDVLES